MLHAHEHVHFNSDDFQALDFSCGFAAVILRNWKTHKCNLIVSFCCSRHILCTCIKITQQIQRDFYSPPMEERNETFYSIDGKLKRRSGQLFVEQMTHTLDFSNAFLVLLLCAILAVVFVAFVAKMQLPQLSKRNYSNVVEAKPN